jgi:hypothetical protein
VTSWIFCAVGLADMLSRMRQRAALIALRSRQLD